MNNHIKKRRVVITGIGMLTSLGLDAKSNWNAMLAGKSGVTTITAFDASAFPTQIASQIKAFEPVDYMTAKEARRMDRFIQLGYAAGAQAIKDSGLEMDEATSLRAGAYVGSGIGGMTTIEATTLLQQAKGHKKVSPFYIPMSIINMVSGNLSINFALKGPTLSNVTACTTGTHCIGEASRLVEYGDADVMLAGGSEASITPGSVAGFSSARALSRNNENPRQASRPWDKDRDGFVMGEGAGVLILEELEHAKKRGAKIYAEITGFGMSSDAYHITSPAPGGEGASRCMDIALQHAGVNTDQVDYINAHGTSTQLGDVGETIAIKRSFGDHARRLTVGSTKSMIGHLLGAAGGVEAAVAALSIYHDAITPTINLEAPGDECDLDYVPHTSRDATVNVALSNSFGFGGTNGTLVLQKHS